MTHGSHSFDPEQTYVESLMVHSVPEVVHEIGEQVESVPWLQAYQDEQVLQSKATQFPS